LWMFKCVNAPTARPSSCTAASAYAGAGGG
jgi:hypothetical protein